MEQPGSKQVLPRLTQNEREPMNATKMELFRQNMVLTAENRRLKRRLRRNWVERMIMWFEKQFD